MRDKNGRNTREPAGMSEPAKMQGAVSHEDRRDMAGRFTTSGGKVKSEAAGKKLRP